MIKSFFNRAYWVLAFLALSGCALYGANLDSLLKEARAMPFSIERAHAMVDLCTQYQTVNPEKALEIALEVVHIAESLDSTFMEGMAYINVGTSHFYKGDYQKALEAYGSSLTIMKNLGGRSYMAKIYINIGSVYINMGNFEQAETSLLKGKAYVEPHSKSEQVLNSNLAIVFTQQEKYEKARRLHLENLALYDENDHRTRSLTFNNVGYIYEVTGETAKALEYYMEAYREAKIANSNYEKGYALVNVISSLIGLERFTSAENYMDTLWPVINAQGEPRMMGEAYRLRAEMSEKQGNFAEALARYQEYVALNDSLSSVNHSQKVAELQSQLDLAARDAEITLMEKEQEVQVLERKRQNQFIWLLGGGILILLAGLGILIWLFVSRNSALAKVRESSGLIQEQYELLKAQKSQLEDVNREKEGLIGVVAHDLKSPLSKTLALANMVIDQGGLSDAQNGAMSMILRTNASANELIRDLLDLNSIELGEEQELDEPVDLEAFFADLKGSFEGEALRKSLRVTWPENVSGVRLHTNVNSLTRIIDNLVSNAIKFSPAGKGISISCDNENGQLHISVQDEGPGISAEDQQKMFKRFQRLSARPTGGETSTGLGLAITKTLVEKMGGKIVLKSQVGQGAKFTVSLPFNPFKS